MTRKILRSKQCEPPRDKTNKVTMRPAKTQISLGIHPVWSESSLCAQSIAKDPSFLHADSEDSDQTGRMPRLIWVFAVRTLILLVLSWGGSYVCFRLKKIGMVCRIIFCLLKFCIGFIEIVSILRHLSVYLLSFHNKMLRVGVKRLVGSGNLKHTYISFYNFWSLFTWYQISLYKGIIKKAKSYWKTQRLLRACKGLSVYDMWTLLLFYLWHMGLIFLFMAYEGHFFSI